jgi:large subunit ribosomal protein L13
MRTRTVKASDVRPDWYVVDATGQTLGRLASRIAQILRGKGKPLYAPYMDVGDFVVVVNASRIAVTGTNKLSDKYYYRHSGYPGGLRRVSMAETLARHPERVIEHAVRGMLPRGPLGRHMFGKLKAYPGPAHPHQAQQPKEIELK